MRASQTLMEYKQQINNISCTTCLKRAFLTSQVFERAREYKRCGAGVALAANGQNALDAIDHGLLQWCMENSLELEGSTTFDHTGKLMYSIAGVLLSVLQDFIQKIQSL